MTLQDIYLIFQTIRCALDSNNESDCGDKDF
jgi:hypothetical protein